MFLRIYLGLLAAVSLALLSSYLIFSAVNQMRMEAHNKAIYAGTFQLIKAGLSRHQGQKQREWLAIVKRLSGLPLSLTPLDSTDQAAKQAGKFDEDNFRFQQHLKDHTYQISMLIGQDQILKAEIESVSEQQLRVASLLILNELGRTKPEHLHDKLEQIQRLFSFPLTLGVLSETHLDSSQRARVRSGSATVVLNATEDGDSHSVYALINKQQDRVLIYGPIPIFVETPLSLLVSLLTLSILIIGLAAYGLVRRLEVRLQSMSRHVERFGPEDLTRRLNEPGDDAVAQLADNLDSMAGRIASLIEDQKHMSQAISHELRTPIARMKFRLDMLEMQTGNATSLDKIDGLKRDLNELNTLIDEALFFQKIDSLDTLMGSSIETLLLPECCLEITEKALPLASGKTLSMAIPDGTQAQANGTYLRRLLQNLILNALRYCHERVEISYQCNTDEHILIIDDDGEGIPKDLRESLFQPFQRAETSRNKKSGGYGLGLAIVKRIADLHRGQIIVTDSPLGGAQFRFSWPKKL